MLYNWTENMVVRGNTYVVVGTSATKLELFWEKISDEIGAGSVSKQVRCRARSTPKKREE